MILKTKVPGRIVQRRVRKPGGGYRIKPWFRFDDEGLAVIDETKLTKSDIIKFRGAFDILFREVIASIQGFSMFFDNRHHSLK